MAGKIKAYTIQPLAFWEALQRDQEAIADGRRVIFKQFYEPYAWMREQLKKKVSSAKGAYPIWFWVKPTSDLRKIRFQYGRKGQKMVVIHFEIPSSECLLSDFDHWHAVLNRSYLFLNDKEEKIYDNLTKLPKSKQNQLIKESWQKIFNTKKSDYIQGVTESLSLNWVTKVQHYLAK